MEERTAELQKELINRSQIEDALVKSEDRFRTLTESTSDWIWEVDENATYTYTSPKIRELLGYEPEEILGKAPFDLMPPEEAKRGGAEFGAITEMQNSFNGVENQLIRKDGRIVVMETSGVPIIDSNGVFRGYRGIDRDITDRKRAEEKLLNTQKLESLGFLAGGIAHDFNNLLGGIFGNIQLAMVNSFSKEEVSIHLETTIDPVLAHPEKYGFSGAIEKPYMLEDLSQVVYDLLN